MIDMQVEPPIKSLLKELEGMQDGLGEKGVRSSLVAGASPVRKLMKSGAPEDFGALKKSIGTKSFNKSERAKLGIANGTAAIYLGPARKVTETRRKADGSVVTKKRHQDYKAYWFEHGVAPHTIGGKVAIGRRSADKNLKFGSVIRRKVQHPGMKKNPFITRAYEQGMGGFEDRAYTGLAKYVEQQRAKRNSR